MYIMDKEDLNKRVEQAVENFKSGYNCSQSVFSAFADIYGVDKNTALLLSSSFGGGIGRMRLTCGAACGMFMLAGLREGTATPKDIDGKNRIIKLVQDLAATFKQQNGSISCAELLGLTSMKQRKASSESLAKNNDKINTCTKAVESAARIWADYLRDKGE